MSIKAFKLLLDMYLALPTSRRAHTISEARSSVLAHKHQVLIDHSIHLDLRKGLLRLTHAIVVARYVTLNIAVVKVFREIFRSRAKAIDLTSLML